MNTPDEADGRTMEQQHEVAAAVPAEWDHRLIDHACASAAYAARKACGRRALPRTEQDDLRQDILLAVLVRASHYDAQRGAQSTFLKVVTRSAIADHCRSARSHAQSEGAEVLPDDIAGPADPEADLIQRISLALVLATLSPSQQRIVALIAECGSAAEAHRASAQPLCTFYRQLRELRMRLRLAGLGPTR
jgi:RNA polymerase sigma factor (sigma-70 family)